MVIRWTRGSQRPLVAFRLAERHDVANPRRTWSTSRVDSSASLLRFDRIERAAHWATAFGFATLMITSLPLYFSQIESHVGRRHLLVEIHVLAGLLLPIPLLASTAGPWGARLRTDLKRASLWTHSEIEWLRTLGRSHLHRRDKFNPGQKANVLFVGAMIVLTLGSGAIMNWVRYFPLEWRTGATFVHDLCALGIFVVVFGHIGFALTHPTALRSIFTGQVPRSWAERHANGWFEEETSVADGLDGVSKP